MHVLSPTTSIHRRQPFMLVVFVAVAAGLIARLYYWQVVPDHPLANVAASEHMQTIDVMAPRGRILDSEGVPLATNVTYYLVYALPRQVTDPVLDAQRLAPILGASTESLVAAMQSPKLTYVVLARKMPPQARDQIEQLSLRGIGTEPDPTRIYPAGTLASQVLGFTDYSGAGRYGVEQYYNRQLSGTNGVAVVQKDGLGNTIGQEASGDKPAVAGDDLHLTIDSAIQYDVEQELAAGVARYGAESGTIVVMDPKTGAILAMANYPTYNPNDFMHAPLSSFVNAAISTPFEPGSTFKIVTMAGGLQAGAITPETTVVDPGFLKGNGYVINDWDRKPHGTVTMRYVLDHSLNVGAAFAVDRLGSTAFYATVRGFHFGQLTGIDLESESPGLILTSQDKGWYPVDMLFNSFGQGLTATALQVTAAVAAVANGGTMVRPYVVQQVDTAQGPQITQTQVTGHPINAATDAVLNNMLEEVPRIGEGTEARIPGYTIAGKTGTAQVAQNGTYLEDVTIASFVGYAPADHPAFVMYISLYHPLTSQYGADTAAPMFGELGQKILVHLGVPPEQAVPTVAPLPGSVTPAAPAAGRSTASQPIASAQTAPAASTRGPVPTRHP